MKYKLGDLCSIKYRKSQKYLSDGDIPVYGSGGIVRYANKELYRKKSVLIPRKGTLSNLFFADTPFWVIDTMFYTEINESIIIPEFLYYQLSNLDLASMNVGTAVPSLTITILENLDITVPPMLEQKRITSTLECLDAKIKTNKAINHHLVVRLLTDNSPDINFGKRLSRSLAR